MRGLQISGRLLSRCKTRTSTVNPSTHFAPRSLAIYSWIVVLATSVLIFVGAMVTTKDVGMAVPDWPLSFGSVNPPGWWHMEGVNWEHGHRLMGSIIGLLVIGLCVGQWRSHRQSWIKWLGVIALVAVILQGIMGGLRVTQISLTWAIFHGCFAQAFFALLVAIAAINSANVSSRFTTQTASKLKGLRIASIAFFAAIYGQLIIGAVMRHHKAGLAIPDFPLAMGRIIPPLDSFGVMIHFAHRAWALVVIAAGLWVAVVIWRNWGRRPQMALIAHGIVLLLALQVTLGALTIWHQRAEIPTTLHVINGAFVLGLSMVLIVRAFLFVSGNALFAADAPAKHQQPALQDAAV